MTPSAHALTNERDLFHRSWPNPAARATVLIVHGMGEHSGRYDKFALHLVACGYRVHALDHAGHGNSPGQRGHVSRFSELTGGVCACTEHLAADYPGQPLILLGHSLGGLIAARHLLDHQDSYVAAVLSAPALRIAVPVPGWKKAMAQFLSRHWPTLALSNELDPKLLSHDHAEVEAYIADPLVHSRVSSRFYTELLTTMDDVLERAGEIRLPTLVISGGDDQIVDPAGAIQLHRDLGSERREVHVLEGLYHEVLNELDPERVHHLVSDWIDRELA